MAQKRQDIQGIRGWAIALVVTFHFFPAYCPNGYVGVDMFFVVSGFLMAMIITRTEMAASFCQNFYYRRIKLILPLYYMTSAAILLLVVSRLPSFRLINFPSLRRAIFLITNFRLYENDPAMDHEKMLSNADDLFTHTWSLCVEMQWYLLAPLLFFVQTLLPLRRVLFFLGITCISLGFYLTTDSNTAFYNTFARMWQFCVGIIAFLSGENLEREASLVIKDDYSSKTEALMRQLNAAEAEDAQHMWHKECKYSRRFANITPPTGFCEIKNGNGRIDMLIAGNSFACNQGDVIYKAFKRYARQFNIFCISRCEMFYPNCRFSFNFTQVVKELKPEVVFMIDRAITMKAPLNVSKPIDDDRVFGLFMKTLKLLEKTTRKVYILQALPSCKLGCANRAVNYLQKERPLNTIKDGLIEKDEFFFFARHRIWEIGKRCKNCEIVDYMPVLVDKKGRYLGYNPETNLMYLNCNNHFNTFGKQRIQIVFDELAQTDKDLYVLSHISKG
ncbi:unnamed protein product [Cylicocyclus nassatus]|uniref:Acyltransferase n=1 Tax=Cylicocyclus nassatus TaxID=53992 RepID=A0AA36MAG9_CYLNA|nr:unnamed protein product [Cylicocyclus nassatus]